MRQVPHRGPTDIGFHLQTLSCPGFFYTPAIEILKNTGNDLDSGAVTQTDRQTDIACYLLCKRLRWSRGSVLAFCTQVRGFKTGRSRRIFRAKKSSARPSKAVGPMS
jgi:hypothetical protein